MSRQRNTISDSDFDDLDYFLLQNLTVGQIKQILKARNMSESEVDAALDKITDARAKIKKATRKFLSIVEQHYGDLEPEKMMKKALKYATKYGLSDVETKLFRIQILKGTGDDQFGRDELKTSEMSKFLGNDGAHEFMLRLQPKEHAKLNELHALYDESKGLYYDVRNQAVFYRGCDNTLLTTTYDKTKHNKHSYIHPIVFALFMPLIKILQKRMLYTNIGRMILTRGQAYLKTPLNYMSGGMQVGDITADFELAHDIVFDPNSLAYAPNDSPLENLMKRFRIQIELWRAVLNLRNGKLYATDFDKFDIAGLQKILSSYEWSFFDSPEMFSYQDEGSMLRKLLSVFSFRPTLVNLTDMGSVVLNGAPRQNAVSMGYGSIGGLSRTTFVNIPLVNVRLPSLGGAQPAMRPSLMDALQQTEMFIVHKQLVNKQRSVQFSRDVMFFYVNRKYPSTNIPPQYTMTQQLLNLPPPMYYNMTQLNAMPLDIVRSGANGQYTQVRIHGTNFRFTSALVLVQDSRAPLRNNNNVNLEDNYELPLQTAAYSACYMSNNTSPAYRYEPTLVPEVRVDTQKFPLSTPLDRPIRSLGSGTPIVVAELNQHGVVYVYTQIPPL